MKSHMAREDINRIMVEHGEISILIEQLRLAIKGGTREAVERERTAFFSFLEEHFNYEKGLMEFINYPHVSVHISEHTKLIEICQSVIDGSCSNAALASSICKQITGYLNTHTDSFDFPLMHYIRQKFFI
ncbi:MAG: hypothetical protein WCF85_17630 [Rhodospirillaceae bacterium]